MLSGIRCDIGLMVTKHIMVFGKSNCNDKYVFFIITGSRVPMYMGEPVNIRIYIYLF
jgi:hypothetical protein